MEKSVLVSYLGRNKVFILPASSSDDLACLKKKFLKEFKFQSNVHLEATFERYDKDWDDYVELEKGCTLRDKEKVKAVVTSTLASEVASEVIRDR